jgi:hypothetical protein
VNTKLIEKYLNAGERVIFSLKETIKIDGDDGFSAFLTDFRILFIKKSGLVFKKDRIIDIFLKNLIGENMLDKGIIFRKKFLEIQNLNTTYRIYGRSKVVMEFHKRVNEQLMKVK